jgi:predicted transcriptional regulator of viral defense system
VKWHDFMGLIGGGPLFESSMLLAGPDRPAEVRRQLSRWVAAGRLIQLRRGLYAVAPPFARASPGQFAVAARLRRPSYVSLQSALSFHGAIPEVVPVTTSVTTGRPGRVETALGVYLYRHVGTNLFWGYGEVTGGEGGSAHVALPEKALLDLCYFTRGAIRPAFVRELRLAPRVLDFERLRRFATRTGKRKLIRAAALTARLLRAEEKGSRAL